MSRHTFRSSIAIISLALSINAANAQKFEFNPYEPSLAPIGSPAAPAMSWETDVAGAYQKASEQNLPLILLFTEPQDSLNRQAIDDSRRARFALESDVFRSLADRAVFATCELKAAGAAGTNDFGIRIARTLDVRISPTLLVLAPNPYALNCMFSSNGTNFDALKKELNSLLSRSVSPEATWNPPSPAAAVAQLADAMKRGDLHRVRATFISSFGDAMRDQINLGIEIDNAKERLRQTIASFFGTPVDALNEIGDYQRLESALRRYIDHEVLEVTTTGDVTQVKVRWTVRNGNTVQDTEETFRSVREFNGYRLVSATSADDTAGVQSWVRQNQNVPALLEDIRVNVQRGHYGSAAEAREAALRCALPIKAQVGANSTGATR